MGVTAGDGYDLPVLTPITDIHVMAPGRRTLRDLDDAPPSPEERPTTTTAESAASRRAIRVAVEAEAAHGELVTCRMLVALAAAAMVYLLFAASSLGWSTALRFLALAGVAAGFFGTVWYLLGAPLASRPPLRLVRRIDATLEPTFATVALALVYTDQGAAAAVDSPLVVLYAVVLAAGASRLRPGYTLYSGAIACAQLLAFYYLIVGRANWAGASPWPRVALVAAAAGVLAVLTARMRRLAAENGTEAWRRRRLEDEFGRYVSPGVARAILRGGHAYAAERRDVTVLFCDVRDFTGLCEQRLPEDVCAMLNQFYERMCSIIESHGGTVNKFLGDGLLALFNAPDEHPNHCKAASETAHEILWACRELREQGGLWSELDVGIGLDTGSVVCGPIGAKNRLEYTAIGSTVNRAARLQGLSRHTRHRIVLSKDCLDRLGPRANVIELGAVRLKGFDELQTVFAFRHS